MGILSTLDRFNSRHPWSHNDAFAGFVLRQARAVRRAGGRTAVDVGCGTGNLVARLSQVFPDVHGIEPHAPTAAIATARFADSAVVTIEQRSFAEDGGAQYDFIVFVASLHHMKLDDTLRQAKESLRPGGRIVVVGLAGETRADLVRSLASLALNPLVGFLRHPRRADLQPDNVQAPTAPVAESFDEIVRTARSVLPGVHLRRRLFWRYTATWKSRAAGVVPASIQP